MLCCFAAIVFGYFVFGPGFVLQLFVCLLVLCNNISEEKSAGCVTFIEFLLSRVCLCVCVSIFLPLGAIGWFVIGLRLWHFQTHRL